MRHVNFHSLCIPSYSRSLLLLRSAGALFGVLVSVSLMAQEWQYNGWRNQVQKEAGIVGGEGGQWPQALAVSSDASLLMMGTDVGGLIRSENGGEQWQQANAGYTPRGNCAIAIDPNNANRVIAVGGNSAPSLFGDQIYHGIYLSNDRGRSWKIVQEANICGYRDIREQLVWDPTSSEGTQGSRVAYWSRAEAAFCQNVAEQAEVAPGLYKTTDGGENWALLPNSAPYGQSILKVHPTEGYVYAARSDGFYKSIDGGASFERKEEGAMTGMDVVTTQPNRVYLSKADGIYVSEDAGESFNKVVSTNYPDSAFFVKVSPANPMKMMVQREVASFKQPWYYSHDGGATWTETINDPSLSTLPLNSGRRMYPVWHPTDENTVWSVGGDWVTKSTDGGQTLEWSNSGSSMIAQTGYFAFSPHHPDITLITNQDYNAALTTSRGDVWKYLEISGKGWGGFVYGGYAPNREVLFARDAENSGGPARLVISFDGGNQFDRTDIEVGGAEVGYSDPQNDNTFFLGNLRSDNGGQDWNVMEGCQGVFTHNRADANELFGIDGTRVVASVDGGATWTPVFSTDTELLDIAHDQVNDKFYAVSLSAFYEYERASSTLTDITERTPRDQLGAPNRYHTVAVDPVETSIVYVGNHRNIYATDVAISRSVDGGQEWEPLTQAPRHNNLNGLDAGREVQCIRVHPVTREAWVGGSCYGVWKIPAPNANRPPEVTLTSPTFGSTFQAPLSLTLEATASDADGTISRVEFYQGDRLLGEDTEAPYAYAWEDVPAGGASLQARAYDQEGLYTSSSEVSISVVAEGVYEENFDDGEAPGWEAISGTWTTTENSYQSPEVAPSEISVYQGATFENFVYEVEATPSFNNDFGVLFHYQDADNYYLLRVDVEPKQVFLEKRENGSTSIIDTAVYTQGGSSVPNQIAVETQNGSSSVRINDVLILEGVTTTAFTSGKIGLYADYNPVRFDNVRVAPTIQLAKESPLTVRAQCTTDFDIGRAWQVVNATDSEVLYTWSVPGTGYRGKKTAAPGNNELVINQPADQLVIQRSDNQEVQADTATVLVPEPEKVSPRLVLLTSPRPSDRTDSSQVIRLESNVAQSRLLVVSTRPITEAPQDNITYRGSATFGQGDALGDGEAFVVGVDSARRAQVTVTGLAAQTLYCVAVFAFTAGEGCGPNYRSASVARTRFSTRAAQAGQAGKALSLYPNPSSDKLSVRVKSSQAETVTVVLIDRRSRRRVLGEYSVSPGTHEFSYDLSSQPDGLYVVEVQSATRRQTRRWMKQ